MRGEKGKFLKDITYGVSTLFLQCVIDRGGSVEEKTRLEISDFRFSFHYEKHPESFLHHQLCDSGNCLLFKPLQTVREQNCGNVLNVKHNGKFLSVFQNSLDKKMNSLWGKMWRAWERGGHSDREGTTDLVSAWAYAVSVCWRRRPLACWRGWLLPGNRWWPQCLPPPAAPAPRLAPQAAGSSLKDTNKLAFSTHTHKRFHS